MWYSWKYGHLSSGITTSWPANQSDAKLLEGGVYIIYILYIYILYIYILCIYPICTSIFFFIKFEYFFHYNFTHCGLVSIILIIIGSCNGHLTRYVQFTVGHRRQVTAVARLPRWRRWKTRLQARALLTMLWGVDRCDFRHASRCWI